MKKLLSVLLALILPVCGLAETYSLSIRVETNEDSFPAYVSEMLKGLPEYETIHTEEDIKLIQQILEGISADITIQDNACSTLLRLNKKELVDATVYQTNDELIFTSSMVPEYAIAIPVESESSLSMTEESEWEKIYNNIFSVVSEWIAELDQSESHGIIVGDAFEGGSSCTAWCFDDRDVAVLIDRVLDLCIHEGLFLWLNESAANAETLIENFTLLNQQVAEKNGYEYIVRMIQDEDNAIKGVSFSVLQHEQQVATVSLGSLPDGIKTVIGLGIGQENYWCEITAKANAEEEHISLITTVREWAGAKDETFSYVQALHTPANICEWQLDVTSDESNVQVNSVLIANGHVLMTLEGMYDHTLESIDGRLYLGDNKTAPVSVSYDIKTADPIKGMDQTLTVCSLNSPEDAELLDTIMQKLGVALISRLLKILPVEQMIQ